MKPKKVIVNDLMQQGYTYYLTEPIGKNFDSKFKPELTPKEMLHLGVFGGKYMSDCKKEFPASWTKGVKFSHEQHDPKLNYFKINASLSLKEWKDKGWIYYEDPRGWFQWYCRYYYGRRIPLEDTRQIKRWYAIRRHVGLLRSRCLSKDLACMPKARQALLHWAYDSRKM